jgi:hypothetical protein
MRARLLLATLTAAAIAVPVSAAHAACTPKLQPTGAWACVEVGTVTGGVTTATSVTVDVLGAQNAWCIDRITVTTSGVEHDPQTVHSCY